MSANYRPGQLEGILETARRRGLIVSDTVKGANLPIQPPPVATLAPSGGQDSGKKKAKGKRRREMNGTETEFSRILEAKQRRGDIDAFEYEAITLRWPDGMRYTPDFVIYEDRGDLGEGRLFKVTLIEVKGAFAWQKDIVKFRAARDKWGNRFRFQFWQKVDGEWQETR